MTKITKNSLKDDIWNAYQLEIARNQALEAETEFTLDDAIARIAEHFNEPYEYQGEERNSMRIQQQRTLKFMADNAIYMQRWLDDQITPIRDEIKEKLPHVVNNEISINVMADLRRQLDRYTLPHAAVSSYLDALLDAYARFGHGEYKAPPVRKAGVSVADTGKTATVSDELTKLKALGFDVPEATVSSQTNDGRNESETAN